MERDLELGVKKETSTSAEDNEIFFDCEEYETVEDRVDNQQSDDHPHSPQDTVGVQDSKQLPCLSGHNLRTISKIFTTVAGTAGFALLVSFLGLTFTPTSSILYVPLDSSCGAPADSGPLLYEVVSVGLSIALIEFLASLLGAGNKEAEAAVAEPGVPVMRRVCVFIATAAHICLTVSMLWSILLALSLRMGKISCWKGVYSGMLFTGFSIISGMSMYMVYIGFACVFRTN